MRFQHWAALMLGVLLASAGGGSVAQGYPDRPVKLIVGLAAGGPTDLIARIFARRLSEQIGQPVVVDNKAGAAGAIAAEFVARAEPDGYTLLWASSSLALLPIVAPNSKFAPERDLLPVTGAASAPSVLLVRGDSPYKTFGELSAAAKARPGQLTFGSPGVGTSSHLAGAVMMHSGGIPGLHIPYKGNAPAMQDVMGGQIDFMFDSTLTAMPMIKAQKLRPLAVTPAKRSTVLPDVPTLDESGITGFEMVPWFGIFAPRGTPAAAINRLSEDMQRVVAKADVVNELAARGAEPYYKNSQELQLLLTREVAMWKTKLQEMGLNLAQ